MDNASERDHKPKLHCACCQLHWENVLIVRKSLAEAEAQIAAAQAENERLREAAQLMVRYFESGNGVPVYRATILGNCEAVIQLRAALAKEPPR